MTALPKRVRIVEVGPRDGLQNESKIVATQDKAEFIRLLAAAGLKDIEVASFAHPKWVPQLADAQESMFGIPRLSQT
jgi:hydroxymethylglutaryl-CoA lyase